MTYTKHGHHIPNTPSDDEVGQVDRSRCGGVFICVGCHNDALAFNEESYEDISGYSDDPDRFLKQAKLFVVGSFNNRADDGTAPLSVEDLYIVWFSKTLQNWKALISTNRSGDGLYFEVTHNGDKEETYVDTYLKISNDKFSQESDI